MKRWLVIVENDLEPRLVGPFKSEEERDGMAKFHKEERGDEDGIFPLDIKPDPEDPEIWAYCGGFFG